MKVNQATTVCKGPRLVSRWVETIDRRAGARETTRLEKAGLAAGVSRQGRASG
jgi:hypothetical protein